MEHWDNRKVSLLGKGKKVRYEMQYWSLIGKENQKRVQKTAVPAGKKIEKFEENDSGAGDIQCRN